MILRNYHALKSYSLFSTGPHYVSTAGADAANSNGMPNFATLLKTINTSYSAAGVVFGDGDTEETLYDYKLAGSVISGITYSYTITSGVDELGPWVKAKYTITNNNTSAITIKEAGVTAFSGCLVERTVFPTPITIEGNAGVGQIEYTIRYDVPTMTVEAFEALDQAGVYGVEWNYGKSSTKLTRFGDAAAFADPAPATALDETGSSPFDDIQPWAGMKRYNVVSGAITASEDDDGFSMTDNDTVVYIPEFYYAVADDPYSRRLRWAISMEEKDGFVKHPGSGRYIGRYHTSVVSSTYSSKSGYSPKVSITRATARTNSHSKGDNWWLMDYATWSAIQMLYLVEYADWNSQSVLGAGQNSGSVTTSGGTDASVYHSLKRDGASNQYRWIEDPWSNVRDWVDGIVFSSNVAYLNLENANNGDSVANHTSSGKTLASGGYISRYHYCATFPWAFLPRSSGGASGTYVTDYVNSGNVCPSVGGSYSASADSGLFYINSNNTSNNNSNLGSRLLVHLACADRSMPLGKNIAARTGSSRFFSNYPEANKEGGCSMPKKVGYLYEKMCDRKLIRQTIEDGTKGKRKRWDVKSVMDDVDGYVERTYQMLMEGSFVPSKPRLKTILDKSSGKERTIHIVPYFPDGLVHQLCVHVMQDVLMRGMYRWSCASIPGRGNKCAGDYVRRALDRDPKGTKYCLKMDIYHYYPSISPRRLIWALARKVKDKKFLKLVYDIIVSNPEGGLSIGYYINQWLANYYLETLDHYILTLPGVKHYVRNMDDMVILGPNKKQLHKARVAVQTFLARRLGLCLKENWQVFPVKARGIDFVGYRYYPKYTIMRRRNFLRFARQSRRVQRRIEAGRPISFHMAAGFLSRAGQLKHCDAHKIRVKYVDPIGVKHLKTVVREESRRRTENQIPAA